MLRQFPYTQSYASTGHSRLMCCTAARSAPSMNGGKQWARYTHASSRSRGNVLHVRTSLITSAFAAQRVSEKLEMSVPQSRVSQRPTRSSDTRRDISSEDE